MWALKFLADQRPMNVLRLSRVRVTPLSLRCFPRLTVRVSPSVTACDSKNEQGSWRDPQSPVDFNTLLALPPLLLWCYPGCSGFFSKRLPQLCESSWQQTEETLPPNLLFSCSSLLCPFIALLFNLPFFTPPPLFLVESDM